MIITHNKHGAVISTWCTCHCNLCSLSNYLPQVKIPFTHFKHWIQQFVWGQKTQLMIQRWHTTLMYTKVKHFDLCSWISPNNRDHHTQCCLSLSSLPSGVFLASLEHNVFLGHYRKPDMTRHEKGAGRIERRAGGRSPCFSTSYFCAKSNTPCTWVFLILTPLQSIKETASHQC